MKPKRGIPKIIQTLALAGTPLTPYAIAERSRLSKSLVHSYIKDPKNGLERNNIVKRRSETPWRAGMKRTTYLLSFKGMVEFLTMSLLGGETETAIKKFIEKYNKFYDYPLFREHEFLAKWLRQQSKPLGEKIYREYAITAYALKEHPPTTFYLGPGLIGYLPSLMKHPPRVILPDKKPILTLEDEDKIWMHGYALCFIQRFDIWFPRGELPNEGLRKFFRETIGKEMKSLKHGREMLKGLEIKLVGDTKVHGGAHAEKT